MPSAAAAQLESSEGNPFVQAPADGMCLYHCGAACSDWRRGVWTHDRDTGLAHAPPLRTMDLEQAGRMRDAVIAAAVAAGEHATAARLRQKGKRGYPGQDEMPYLASAMKGQIVLQSGDVQEVFGNGPLVAHIAFKLVRDSAGMPSGHFVALQSLSLIHI